MKQLENLKLEDDDDDKPGGVKRKAKELSKVQ